MSCKFTRLKFNLCILNRKQNKQMNEQFPRRWLAEMTLRCPKNDDCREISEIFAVVREAVLRSISLL